VIAALYVQRGGVYFGLPDVDPWDEARDARLYAGPWPVVAHPPCSTWSCLAPINRARYGHAVGADGGCFAAALASVRRWGGVLEHPALSRAWAAHGIGAPARWGWQRNLDGSWLCEVSQAAYGHRAAKMTRLLVISLAAPSPMRWERPAASGIVSFLANHAVADLPRLPSREAKATPLAFRDALLSLARGARLHVAPVADHAPGPLFAR
jgi:hypothetical protein